MDRPFDIIATRTLDIVDDRGCPTRQVFVHLGRPWQEPTGEWSLPYQIIGLGKGTVYRVHGFDAIQALQGVQLVIGGLLASFDEAEQGRLRWDGDPDLGFPVPPVSGPDR
jgi:hypothetical protein